MATRWRQMPGLIKGTVTASYGKKKTTKKTIMTAQEAQRQMFSLRV